MAKQSVNIIERHVEKGLLGLCAVVLLTTVVLFGVTTPNTVEISGERVGPGQVDQKVLEAAHALRENLRRTRAEPVEVKDPVPEFEDALSPLAYSNVGPELPSPVPLLPRVPSKFGSTPIAGEIELAEVIAPGAPNYTNARATLALPPPVVLEPGQSRASVPAVGVEFERPVNWVTVAALFDQQEQMAVYRNAGYQVNRRIPYVVGVNLQRREKLPDGSYGEWVDVEPYMPFVLLDPPEVELVQGRIGVLIPTEESREAVSQYFGLVRRVQADLIRPLFPEVVYGEGWLYPKFADINVRALDLELCTADSCEPRSYPRQWDTEPEEDEAEVSLRERIEQMLAEGESAVKRRDWEEVEDIVEEIEELNKSENVRRDQLDRAEKLRQTAAQGKRDEERGRLPPKEDADSDEDDIGIGRRSPYQLVWAHDAADQLRGGAESGKTYQYRIRLRLYNRFVGVPQDLDDPDDAKIIAVPGEWSEPTGDVHIEPDTAFFLTRGNINTRSGAKVTVFKWFEGVWVEESVQAEIGQRLGGSSQETVRLLEDGQEDRPLVDFDTGAVVVDIDYDYTHRPKKERGREGFTVGPPVPTVALVYMDEQSGELHQRIYEEDKSSHRYKEFKEKVFDPRKTRR